jgi:hypothetical protein
MEAGGNCAMDMLHSLPDIIIRFIYSKRMGRAAEGLCEHGNEP